MAERFSVVDDTLVLSGGIALDELDELLAALAALAPARSVIDLRECTHLHAGVVQALLRTQAQILPPADDFLRELVAWGGVPTE